MFFNFKRIKLEKDKAKHPPNVWIDTKPTMGGHGTVELQSEIRRPMRPSRVSFVSKGNVSFNTVHHLKIQYLDLDQALKSCIIEQVWSNW